MRFLGVLPIVRSRPVLNRFCSEIIGTFCTPYKTRANSASRVRAETGPNRTRKKTCEKQCFFLFFPPAITLVNSAGSSVRMHLKYAPRTFAASFFLDDFCERHFAIFFRDAPANFLFRARAKMRVFLVFAKPVSARTS